MNIKYEQGKSSKNMKEELENNKELNDYIRDNVRNPNDWIIYANDNFFLKDDRPEDYKGIMIIYNDFIMSASIIILVNKTRI